MLMTTLNDIKKYRRDNLINKNKYEKEQSFEEFLKKVKEENFDKENSLKILKQIRGIK